jgi:hypothetical protein
MRGAHLRLVGAMRPDTATAAGDDGDHDTGGIRPPVSGDRGALYGQASHGWRASFTRPGVRSRIPGLYLAGGSTHPGPGVPMAALSGRMAAACLLSDVASTRPSRKTAMSGGMSTR